MSWGHGPHVLRGKNRDCRVAAAFLSTAIFMTRRRRSHSAQSGFTLIEAIVALALMGGVGVVLLSWLNSSLIGLGRIDDALKRVDALRMASEFIATVNPSESTTGLADLGPYRLSWNAKLLEGPQLTVVNPEHVPGSYEIGLYRTRVVVSQQKKQIAEFELQQVGSRRTDGV